MGKKGLPTKLSPSNFTEDMKLKILQLAGQGKSDLAICKELGYSNSGSMRKQIHEYIESIKGYLSQRCNDDYFDITVDQLNEIRSWQDSRIAAQAGELIIQGLQKIEPTADTSQLQRIAEIRKSVMGKGNGNTTAKPIASPQMQSMLAEYQDKVHQSEEITDGRVVDISARKNDPLGGQFGDEEDSEESEENLNEE